MKPLLFAVACWVAAADVVSAGDKEDKDVKEWANLFKYVEIALPLPDGKRLSEESRAKVNVRKLYHDEEAKDAARLAVRTVKGLEDKIAAFVKEHILRIRLAGVTAVERDDLHVFLKTLGTDPVGLSDAEKKLLEGIRKGEEAAFKKVPKRGWIVEVRGTTFHHKGAEFVRDTLLENLAAPDEVNELAGDLKDVQDRTGFFILYETRTTKDDALVFKSPLRGLAESGKLGKEARAVDKKTYETVDKRGKDEPPVARTDFSILFLWYVEAPKKDD